MNFFEYLAAALSSHFFAGAAGGIVRAITARTNNFWEAVIGGISGALTAGYATPAVTNYLEIGNAASANSVAFLIGLLGVYFAESLMRIAARYAQNPVIPTTPTIVGVIDAISSNNNKNNNDERRDQSENSRG